MLESPGAEQQRTCFQVERRPPRLTLTPRFRGIGNRPFQPVLVPLGQYSTSPDAAGVRDEDELAA